MECRRYQCWGAETTALRDTSDVSYPHKRHVNRAKRGVNGSGSSLRVGRWGVKEAYASGVVIGMDEGATDPWSPQRTNGVVPVPERASLIARTECSSMSERYGSPRPTVVNDASEAAFSSQWMRVPRTLAPP
jgi:hypothetical protein